MKKFIIDNLKYVFSFILGAIVFGGTAVYAYNFATDQVKHTKSDGSETTTELALNELYQMYDADTIILSKIYPVGSYFISASNTNPHDIFGGTWIQITDKVLVAAGSTYTAGSTGGNGTLTYTPNGTVGNHTLTIDEIPAHSHKLQYVTDTAAGSRAINDDTSPSSSFITNGAATLPAGGGGAHNHPFTGTQATLQTMDSLPRETVYVWKRTA